VQIEFLLGPAGSGKTFRCITEARSALEKEPDGPPLILLAPKQATFQLERQILEPGGLAGYTRLKILSFERLANLVLEHFEKPASQLLDEEGRVMVLRALLAKHQQQLRLFRSSAGLPGFAREVSLLLRELQHHQFTAASLRELALKIGPANRLDQKLQDVAAVVAAYFEWLRVHDLQDAGALLDLAAEALLHDSPASISGPSSAGSSPAPIPLGGQFQIEMLWMDGFAQLTAQERKLLRALIPFCGKSTLAFCIDPEALSNPSWFSPWTVVSQNWRQLQSDLTGIPNCTIRTTQLARDPARSRFSQQPVLCHLEKHWADPHPEPLIAQPPDAASQQPVRIVACANPEAEATFAAREILRHVRAGRRYREIAVLVRHLDDYHDSLRRVFTRFEIPFFMDRREPVAHHPLAELTRGALLTICFQWRHQDWFSALKSGLVHDSDHEIDRLENEALAKGWEGKTWQSELPWAGDKTEAARLEGLRHKLVEPFVELASFLRERPSGRQLAQGLRSFWERLNVRQTLGEWSQARQPPSKSVQVMHATVWQQMNEWLDNVEIAFSHETLPLSEWLPILETGLSSLTIGLVPPVLDQVLIGAIDRSRNPDLQQIYLLGMNETVFPALPTSPSLLSDTDRSLMENHGRPLGLSNREQAGQERFLGYIACTRARGKLIMTYASRNSEGKALNPSGFISHLERMFPALANREKFSPSRSWLEHEHPSEMLPDLLRVQGASSRLGGQVPSLTSAEALSQLRKLAKLEVFEPVLSRLKHLHTPHIEESLAPGMTDRLYGAQLKTSVSQFEQFAACPFRFFISSGLQAQERLKYELDVRQQGSFQHKVLEKFHHELRSEHKQWRDLTPAEASQRIGTIADELIYTFENGLLNASEQNRFLGRTHKKALQKLIQAIIGWMAQYQLNPEAVEMGFGFEDELPPFRVDLGGGRALLFRGRIDRVDLWRVPGKDEALCVVIDYKSSSRELKPLYLAHGLHQQLPAYLNALRRLDNTNEFFGVSRLIPAGAFYVNLSGSYKASKNRNESLSAAADASQRCYAHEGLLNFYALDKLDSRGASSGDQFSYSITKEGKLHKRCSNVLPREQFESALDRAEDILRELGARVYNGDVKIDPYKHGNEIACGRCCYQAICRIDSWTHSYRTLRDKNPASDPPTAEEV
jgi:ATP-dependent helicase/nuclease subunit B